MKKKDENIRNETSIKLIQIFRNGKHNLTKGNNNNISICKNFFEKNTNLFKKKKFYFYLFISSFN
jgi:hypothetical protein